MLLCAHDASPALAWMFQAEEEEMITMVNEQLEPVGDNAGASPA